MNNMFDANSAASIISYAKNLKGKNLREVCGSKIEKHGLKEKVILGRF